MQKYWNLNTEISRILHGYFDSEGCSLIGDTIVDGEAKEIGKLVSASYTGIDLILQVKFVVRRDEKNKMYEDQVVIVNKNDVEE